MTPFFKYFSGLCAAILLAAALVAVSHADTAGITLGPDGCGIVKQCYNIPNDAGLAVNLYGAPGYPFFYVNLNGIMFKASSPSGDGGTQVPMVDDNGDVIYLTYAFTTYRTCNHSGRGQSCSTHWQLTSGSITQ